MTVVELIVAGLVVLGVSMYIRHRRENPPVDMNHKAPNVHNVQMSGRVGPAPVKKVAKKKATKKKTTKKAIKK
jgi:hypothetical protein